ncbi:MAG: tRNA-dihydrouridine synthase family protein [Clostridia bacterium]|nr:tRNA-dihydrouridine synthase family protein [Clostridia bacterium]
MKLYFAPMEGITSYTFRNTHAEIFGGCDEYFAPFIVPSENERISRKTLRDIIKENNRVPLRAQVLCSSGKAFVQFAERVKYAGFDEVNLNLGCPSGTVVKKGRGAGALKDTDALDEMLDYIFSNTTAKVSVKTRTGFYSHEEFDEIMRVFNRYPICELIIHPRVREDFYKGSPNMEAFDRAYRTSPLDICYNGDVFSKEGYEKIAERYPKLTGVMIGRGAIINPALFREIKGGKKLATDELLTFSRLLEKRYMEVLKCEAYTIHRLKEMWIFVMQNFPEEKKILKAIKKANKLSDLNSAIEMLPEL